MTKEERQAEKEYLLNLQILESKISLAKTEEEKREALRKFKGIKPFKIKIKLKK